MTISSETRKAGPFNGNDVTTSFPFTFKVFTKTDIQVILTDINNVETTLVLDSDYTVLLNLDQNSNAGGTISYSSLATGEKLTIVGAVEYTQETDIQNQGGFYPEVIENALDKITMQIQQVKEIADRSVQVPVSSDTLPEEYLATVQTLKQQAETAASNASASETAAGLSEAAALLAKTNAETAETNAELAEANAEAAQAAAAISASEAEAALSLITTVATTTSSVTSNSISIAQKTFTVEAGKSFFVGMSLRAAFNATNYVNGEVVSYSGTTLVLNVLSVKGSGTYAVWAIFQSQDSVLSLEQVPDLLITNAKLANAYINDLTAVEFDYGNDFLAAADGSDSGNKKKVRLSGSPIIDVDATVAANDLTVTINPCTLHFRSTTLTDGSPLPITTTTLKTVVVPSGATLGTVNAVAARLAILAINNAGTIETAIINLAGGNQLDESGLISTTAVSAAADANNVAYSTTARSNVAYRVVGFIDITEATAGTWATAPTLVQGCGGQALAALSSLGYGQTWQSFTVGSGRVLGTTYYNTTGKPIVVMVSQASATGTNIIVGGLTLALNGGSATVNSINSAIVPANMAYSVTGAAGSWFELR
jgi:hypothetical protein